MRSILVRYIKWVLMGLAFQLLGWLLSHYFFQDYWLKFIMCTAVITNTTFILTELWIYRDNKKKRG